MDDKLPGKLSYSPALMRGKQKVVKFIRTCPAQTPQNLGPKLYIL